MVVVVNGRVPNSLGLSGIHFWGRVLWPVYYQRHRFFCGQIGVLTLGGLPLNGKRPVAG